MFRKFGNYSESYADTNLMDFSRATVQEKVDGSLFKFFFDKGSWRLATNGTINSFKAECGDTTFGNVFYSIIRAHSSIEDFLIHMKTSRTYLFEIQLHNPLSDFNFLLLFKLILSTLKSSNFL